MAGSFGGRPRRPGRRQFAEKAQGFLTSAAMRLSHRPAARRASGTCRLQWEGPERGDRLKQQFLPGGRCASAVKSAAWDRPFSP